MNQLFFVARQRPDIFRHTGHVFLGVKLDSVFTVLMLLELFGCYVGVNAQTVKCLLQFLLESPVYEINRVMFFTYEWFWFEQCRIYL